MVADPQRVRDFHGAHGRIIYKSCSSVRSIVQEWNPDDPHIERIRQLPTQFQAFVPGVNVRVHVVGGRPYDLIPRMFATADIVAVPSLSTPYWQEQFGFVLAEAINQGIPLSTTINSPEEMNIPDEEFENCDGPYAGDGEGWNVSNSTGSGTFDLYSGTQQSVNTFFAQLQVQTGMCEPLKLAADMGLGED